MKSKPPKNSRSSLRHQIVCIGASAGGVTPLEQIVEKLEADFEGTILIVLHTSSFSQLPYILSRKCLLNVGTARDG